MHTTEGPFEAERDRWRAERGANGRHAAPAGGPEVGSALARAYDAGKSTVSARLALMRLDVQRAVSRMATGGIALGLAALLLLTGWAALSVGTVLWMGMHWGHVLPLGVRLLIMAGLTTACGVGFLFAGIRALHAGGSTAPAPAMEPSSPVASSR